MRFPCRFDAVVPAARTSLAVEPADADDMPPDAVAVFASACTAAAAAAFVAAAFVAAAFVAAAFVVVAAAAAAGDICA